MNEADNFSPSGNDGFFRSMFTDPLSGVFRIWVGILNFAIFISCLSLAGETVSPYSTIHADLFKLIEYSAVFLFTIDYLGNIYFAKDRVKYFFSFWGIVDLISILPTYLMLLNLTALQGSEVLSVLRVLRVLRVLKMARIALEQLRHTASESNPLWINLKIYFIALFSVIMISSTSMYYAEGDLYSSEALAAGQARLDAGFRPNPLSADAAAAKFVPTDPVSGNPIPAEKRVFTSIPAAMWWSVGLTATGYGDMYPVTFWGRVIAGLTMLMGLILFGILLNIVGKTIMVMLFGEPVVEDTDIKATRETILGMMVARDWITQERAEEIELLSEDEIKARMRSL